MYLLRRKEAPILLSISLQETSMRRHLSYTFIVMFAVVLFLSPVAAAQSPNPVGEWNLQSDAQGQITKFTLTITKEGDILKGKVASEQYGAQDLKDLKVENGIVTYTR